MHHACKGRYRHLPDHGDHEALHLKREVGTGSGPRGVHLSHTARRAVRARDTRVDVRAATNGVQLPPGPVVRTVMDIAHPSTFRTGNLHAHGNPDTDVILQEAVRPPGGVHLLHYPRLAEADVLGHEVL